MKKLLFLTLILISLTGCNDEKEGYIIKGEIKGDNEVLKNGIIFLRNQSREYLIIDSTAIINGKFVFKGSVETPDTYVIFTKGIPYSIPLFIENDRFKIEGDSDNLREAKIKGGKTQQFINDVKNKDNKTRTKYNISKTLNELSKTNISEKEKAGLIKIIEQANKEMREYIDSIIKENPLSYYTLMNTTERANTMDLAELENIYDRFRENDQFVNNRNVIKLKNIIKKRKKLEFGKIAPDFTLKDNKDKLLSLSDIYKKNDLNLVIFWASWNKNSLDYYGDFIEIYHRCHSRGLEIIGVSVNDIEKNWKGTLAKKSLKWVHLIDNTEDSISVAIKYNIQFIPYNLLIDNHGKIIAKNITIEDLQKAVDSKL